MNKQVSGHLERYANEILKSQTDQPLSSMKEEELWKALESYGPNQRGAFQLSVDVDELT